jgi:hypothetical protein
MSALRKLGRDFLSADLTAVDTLISQLTDEDVLTRFSLEARRAELQKHIHELEEEPAPKLASAALFFGGRPVVASRGIETEFGGTALSKFQDLVSKVMAHKAGGLGQRGTVPHKASSILHVTNIVRGSFGFLLEEVESPQSPMLDTSLKDAVDEATSLLESFGEEDEDSFQAALDGADQRIVATAKEFFDLIRHNAATFRIIAGDSDKSFGTDAVSRAAERAVHTTIEEASESVEGQLGGTLPHAHQFEFTINDERGTIRGRVDRSISEDTLLDWNRDLVNVRSRAELNVKRVLHDGEIVRESYLLSGLSKL